MASPADPTITCPHCQRPIHLTEALAQPLVDARLAAERTRITAEVQAQAKAAIAHDLEKLQGENRAQKAALDESRKKELALLQKEREVREREETLELELGKKLAAEREKIRAAAAEAATVELGAEVARLRESQAEQAKKLAAAQAAELEMRNEREAFETAQREWNLEKARQLEAERARIREAAGREFAESQRLKDAVVRSQAPLRRSRRAREMPHPQRRETAATLGAAAEVQPSRRRSRGRIGTGCVRRSH